jgi:hypothetical protein
LRLNLSAIDLEFVAAAVSRDFRDTAGIFGFSIKMPVTQLLEWAEIHNFMLGFSARTIPAFFKR